MIFNIATIKSILIDVEPFASNLELRDEFKKTFSFEFLFSNNIIDSICFFKKSAHISLDSSKFIIDYVNNKFNTSFEINILLNSGKSTQENLEFFHIESFEHFKSFFSLLHKEKADNKKKRNAKFHLPLPLDISNKKLLSLDFEFRTTKNHIEIMEMGITISYNNKVNYFHYLTANKKQRAKSFNFGKSVVINKEDFLPILESHLYDVDYIIGHSIRSDYKVLRANKFNFSIIDNIPIIDTSNILIDEFSSFINLQKKSDSISLRDALRIFQIRFCGLHNAGNDSAFTLKLAKELVKIKNQQLVSEHTEVS